MAELKACAPPQSRSEHTLLAGQVADYVWDNYLKSRPHANATYHKLPGANHYLQYDHAADVAAIVLQELLP